MRQDTRRRSQQGADRARRSRRRLKAIICRTGQGDLTDACLLMLGGEADVEQVPTLSEAMQRCLNGRADILFVNMFPITASDLTAISLFRTIAPAVWVVALASADLKPALVSTGIADEVLVAEPTAPGARPARPSRLPA